MDTRSTGRRRQGDAPVAARGHDGRGVLLGRTRETAIGVDMAVRGAAIKLAQRFPDPLWVHGELVEVRSGSNGRFFAVLREGSARIQVHVPPAHGRTTNPPVPGTLVLVQGTLGIWTPGGSFRLEARSPLIPTDHAGVRAEARRAAERELRADGVFHRAKRALPEWPREVAVVSSPRGAAIHDIRAVIRRRAPWVSVQLHECSVEGTSAVPSIIRAMDAALRTGADLIILARGGGAADSLQAFDEPALVRCVALSRIPVIVAIGHEPDSTLADLAADVSAPTPSAAAELAVPDRLNLRRTLQSIRLRVDTAMLQKVRASQHRQADIHRHMRRSATSRLRADRAGLDRLNPVQLSGRLERFVRTERTHLASQRSRLSRSVQVLLTGHRRALEAAGPATLLRRTASAAKGSRARLMELRRTLRALSPREVLARGFAIVLDPEGRVVRTSEQLRPGCRLDVMLVDGVAAVVVETVSLRPDQENDHDYHG